MKTPKPILGGVSDVTLSGLNKSTDSDREGVVKLNLKTGESIDHILNKNMIGTDIFGFLGILKRTLQNIESPLKEQLLRLIDEISINNEERQFPEDKKMTLMVLMYKLRLGNELMELNKIPGFEELVSRIVIIDSHQKDKLFDF